jgi:hypothetical protein
MSVRALASGLKVAEVPSFEFMRLHGKSNLRTFPDGWIVLRTILRERQRRAGRIRKKAVDGEELGCAPWGATTAVERPHVQERLDSPPPVRDVPARV